MLDQRWRRWANVAQMLYKSFVLAGYLDVRFRRLEDTRTKKI